MYSSSRHTITEKHYYPFGMLMPDRGNTPAQGYRYGFNGQEKDDEIAGNGNINTARFWEYDTRLGMRWNLDPEGVAFWSPYSVFYGMPIKISDPNGDCPWVLLGIALALTAEIAVAPTNDHEGDALKIKEARFEHDVTLIADLTAPGIAGFAQKYIIKKTITKAAPSIIKTTEKQILKQVEKKVFEKGAVKTADLTKKSIVEKLDKYLLNPDHLVGKTKAKWFKEALGFSKENASELAKQIIFDTKKAVQTEITQYGTKFNQVISIKGANGKIIDVTFAFLKSKEDDVVRLVTAIPTKK